MGSVRMSVQTADKNNNSNPYDSSPSISILWSEKQNLFAKKKNNKIIETFNFKPLLLTKISVHNP